MMRTSIFALAAASLAACGPASETTADTALEPDNIAIADAGNAATTAPEPTQPPETEPQAEAELEPATPDEPPIGELDDRAHPTRMDLELRIDPNAERFSGHAIIDVEVTRLTDLIWIHGKDLNVTEASFITADGETLAVTYEEVLDSGVAAVRLARPYVGAGVLDFVYDAELNRNLSGVYVTEYAGLRYVASQMQDSDFRRSAPGFDQPRFKVPVTFTINAPAGNIAVTNAPTVSQTELEDGWVRHAFATTRPLPAEVLAIIVGPYDEVVWENMPATDIRDHPVPLRGFAARGKGDRIGYALESTAGILETLEDYFGTPYPYEKLDYIAPTEFSAGAMENPGAITYRESILLIDGNASFADRNRFASVHAHELSHMWFGDLVTPKWWTDIWLNESFASWLGNKTAAAWSPGAGLDRRTLTGALGVMGADSLASARSVRTPIDRTEDIHSAFDGITYQKGAGVLAMFENFVGEDAFRDGVRLHMERYADGLADFNDFAQSISDGSGNTELVAAMTTFITQPGVPLISAELDCTSETPVAHVRQSPYRPLGSTTAQDRRWQVPVCLSHVTGGLSGQTCALLTEETATITLSANSCPAILFPNANGAGYYRFTTDTDGWYALRAGFNTLPATEALVFTDSLAAAFNADVVNAADYLDGLAVAAQSEHWDVASAPRNTLLDMFAIVGADGADDLRAYLSAIYAPRWNGDVVGGDEELLAQIVSATLVFDIHDADRMAELAPLIHATLDNGGDASAAGLPGYAINEAVSAALMLEGEPFYEKLMDAITDTNSPALRAAAISGLAAIWDPTLAARIRDEALTTDRFTGREMANVVFTYLNDTELQDDTWVWVQANFDAYVEKLPAGYRGGMGGVVDNWCDLDRATEARAFIEAHASQLPGYELSLRQAQESAELCTALRDAKGEELAAELAARR